MSLKTQKEMIRWLWISNRPEAINQPKEKNQTDSEWVQTPENEERRSIPRIQNVASGHDKGERRLAFDLQRSNQVNQPSEQHRGALSEEHCDCHCDKARSGGLETQYHGRRGSKCHR